MACRGVRIVAEPCTCPLRADECDGDYGVFLPLGHGGSCAVRPCQKPATPTVDAAFEMVRRLRERDDIPAGGGKKNG
jgi:hypothetical protein